MEFLDLDDFPRKSGVIGKLPKLGTNRAKILMFLLSGDQPTNRQMGLKLDCVSSATRISELRQDGWIIDSIKIPYRTAEGKDVYYCKYFLVNLQEILQDQRLKKFIEWYRKR